MINDKGMSMNKKITFTLVLLCAMLTALVGCGQNVSQEKKIQDLYEEFMEVEMSDPVRAIEEYVYYNDETIKAIAIDSVKGNHTTHYEILRLEKISEQMWAVEVYSHSKGNDSSSRAWYSGSSRVRSQTHRQAHSCQ